VALNCGRLRLLRRRGCNEKDTERLFTDGA
jgi:hypothetical protein